MINNKSELRNEISNIVSLHQNIWTYKYTRSIIKFVTSCENDEKFIDLLQQILNEDTDNGRKNGIESKIIFTEYYMLAHYYRLFNKKDKLILLIEKYRGCFENIPFNEEVTCWYYKRKGDWESAYNRSKQLLTKFDVQDNAGIYANFISTVISMLENEYNSRNSVSPIHYWNTNEDRLNDWEFCYTKSREIINNDPFTVGEKVAAQYAKMGKLLIYSPNLEGKTINEISDIINEANDYFEQAITYQDPNGKNYNKRCMEFRQMQIQCYLHKLDIISEKNNKHLEHQLSDLALTEKTLKESIEHQLAKSLEVISIFTAVITLIITSIGIINGFTLKEAIYLLLITTCSWCLVYSIFVFMLHSGKRMYKSIFIGLIMIVFLFLFTKDFIL